MEIFRYLFNRISIRSFCKVVEIYQENFIIQTTCMNLYIIYDYCFNQFKYLIVNIREIRSNF